MKKLITLLAALILIPAMVMATDYYVSAKKGSNETGDGSQAKQWKTISFALAKISGTGHTIHVAPGNYDTVMDGVWYEIFPLLLKNGVSLVGAGADSTILDADSTAGVIRCINITDTTTRIEGFTIKSGWAKDSEGNGGGIYCSSSSVQILNNIIKNNRANNSGSGIYWYGGVTARILSNKIHNNTAGQFGSSGGGAGIYLSVTGTNSSVQIKNNLIQANQLSGSFGDGGGLNISAASLLMIDNTISNNRAGSSFGDGGGIYLSGYSSKRDILNNQFSNNSASYNGGGIYWYSGSGQISGNQILSNTCNENGGGIYFYSSSSSSINEINRNLLYNNKASKAGGGIYCESSAPKIVNNTLDGNRTGTGGGALYLKSASPEIVNNILSNNELYAIHEADANSDPPCRYNDFWGNGTGLYYDEGARGFNSLVMLESLVPEVHHNFAADPLFVDPVMNDYHLTSSSSCIDAGDPDPIYKDPDSTRSDVGAFYFDQSGEDTTPPPTPINLVADGTNPGSWKNASSFIISWTNPADPSGIARAIYKLGSAPTSNSDTTGSVAGMPPFNLSATQQGGQMLYLWLKDGAGNMNFVNNASVNLRYDATAPSVPTLVSPLNNASNNKSKPVFNWSDATDTGGSGVVGYEIQVDNNVDFSSPEFSEMAMVSTATPANNLSHGMYYWRVRSKDDATNVSNWSTVWTVLIDVQPPTKVTNLNVSATTSLSATLNWTAPGDDGNSGKAAKYDIRYSTTSPSSDTTAWWSSSFQVSGIPAPQSAGSSETFTVAGLQSKTSYFFALKTADEADNWSFISTIASDTTQAGDGGPHFRFKMTADSYSIVVDAATIDGQSLQPGDEIGVFTPAGLCVGASIWTGTTPVALTAWKDDSQTPEIDGYKDGEKMSFRTWDANATTEYPATPTYSQGNGTFGDGAYTRISLLEAKSTGQYIIQFHDTTGAAGSTIDIPVFVNDVSGAGIISLALTVVTDTSVLKPIIAHTSGTLTAGWGAPTFNLANGQITIALSGAAPLNGKGKLIFIKYQVNSKAAIGAKTMIQFIKAMFNEGTPPVSTKNGSFIVSGGHYISGKINYYSNNHPVADAVVRLRGASIFEDTTDVTGHYEFINIFTGNYTSRSEKKNSLNESISPYDAALILQSVVGQQQFSPYQMIAADVSGNGTVSSYDASFILQYFVGLIPKFPVMPDSNHCWTFVPKSFNIDKTNWSKAPDSLRYEPLDSDKPDQNFVGIVYGDPSGNWNPAGFLATAGKVVQQPITIRIGAIIYSNDKILSIPIELDAASDLIAAGLTLEYDSQNLKIIDVSTSELTSGFNIAHNIVDGKLKLALAGAMPLQTSGEIVRIKCKISDPSKRNGSLMTLVQAFVNDGNMVVNIESNIGFGAATPDGFALYQNYPNPLNPETNIKYQIPESGNVELKIFNISGQEIKNLRNEYQQAGCYEVHWDGRDHNGQRVSSGIYIYQIKFNNLTQSKKLSVLK